MDDLTTLLSPRSPAPRVSTDLAVSKAEPKEEARKPSQTSHSSKHTGKDPSLPVTLEGPVMRKHLTARAGEHASKWKPLWAVVKDTKLCFYKLPSELAATAKQLIESPVPEPERNTTKEANTRQRKYWGEGKAPSIKTSQSLDRIVVEEGSVDDLLHEIVFGTQQQDYSELVFTVFLLAPLLGSDLASLCRTLQDYLLAASERAEKASDTRQAFLRRLATLSFTLTTYFGNDFEALSWLLESIESLRTHLEPSRMNDGPPVPSRRLPSPFASFDFESTGADPSLILTTLREGDLDALSSAISDLVRYDQTLLRTSSVRDILAGLIKRPGLSGPERTFAFDVVRPSWLTLLVLETIFPRDHPLSPQDRANVLDKWIQTAEKLRHQSVNAGWVAIAFAVCCRAVMRLDKTWRLVHRAEVVASQWAPILVSLGYSDQANTIKALQSPRLPYLGSLTRLASVLPSLQKVWEERHVMLLAGLHEDLANARDFKIDTEDHDMTGFRPTRLCSALQATRLAMDNSSLASFVQRSILAEPAPPATNSLSLPSTKETDPFAPLQVLAWFADGSADRPSPEIDILRQSSGPGQARRPSVTRRFSYPAFAHLNAARGALKSQEDFGTFNSSLVLGNGQLVLQLAGDPVGSRKSIDRLSRSSSIRPSRNSASSHADFRLSCASRSTTTTMSITQSAPAHVSVVSASWPVLIDLLVLGAAGLSLPTSDAEGQLSFVSGRPLSIDLDSLRHVFFSSTVKCLSSLVVVELLRKRFTDAAELDKLTSDAKEWNGPFFLWLPFPCPTDDESFARMIRLGVIDAIQAWLDVDSRSFVDDVEARIALEDALVAFAKSAKGDGDEKLLFRCEETLTLLRISCVGGYLKTRVASIQTLSWPHDFDAFDALTLAKFLSEVSTSLLDPITELDAVRYVQHVINLKQSDPLAWHSLRTHQKRQDDDITIATANRILRDLWEDDRQAHTLPPGIDAALRAAEKLETWLIKNICDPKLPFKLRVERISKAVDALQHCEVACSVRSHSSSSNFTIASFASQVLGAALVAPESRAYDAAWARVAYLRGSAKPSTLKGFIDRTERNDLVASAPDFASSVLKCIELLCAANNTSDNVAVGQHSQALLLIRQSLDGAKEITPVKRFLVGDVTKTFNVRDAQFTASRERLGRHRPNLMPFHALVQAQQTQASKVRRLRELLEREGRSAERLRQQRTQSVAKAFDKSVAVHVRRKTLSRPSTSTASPFLIERLRSFKPLGNPAFVVPLSGIKVSKANGTDRARCLQIRSEDGQRSYLQFETQDGLESWHQALERIGSTLLIRRGSISTPGPSRLPLPVKKPRPSSATTVFGVPLHCVRPTTPTSTPVFLEVALALIEHKGLRETGIYRISGENRIVQQLRARLDAGDAPDTVFAGQDVHNISGVVKLFLRELPEPLIPSKHYDSLIAANEVEDYEARLTEVREIVWSVPYAEFEALKRLMYHLERVTDHESFNAMHASNLSIIFAPTIIRPPNGPSSFALAMKNLGAAANIIKLLITQAAWIFSAHEQGHSAENKEEVLTDEASRT